MIRPIVAGQFYDDNFDGLNNQIEWCFKSKLGPGSLPVKRGDRKLFGIIVPHAGYTISGPCQAWAYKIMAESRFPSTFIILAPDHSGTHSTVVTSREDWQTPFGLLKVNQDYIDKLRERCSFVKESEIKEHAVEVQLPFLQYVNKDRLKDLTFVPLVIPSPKDYLELGEALAEIDDDVCIVASSDFTHFGPHYDYVPFSSDIKKNMYDLDNGALALIKDFDALGFLEYRNKTGATICGAYPIAVAVEAVKNLFAKRADVVSYYTSGDVLKDYNNAVGYAAVCFR